MKLGYSLTKACNCVKIPRTTVQTWVDENEELRLKITAWQNEPNAKARKNWVKKIKDGDYPASKDWLERIEKDDFSTRAEIAGPDNELVKRELALERRLQVYLESSPEAQEHLIEVAKILKSAEDEEKPPVKKADP